MSSDVASFGRKFAFFGAIIATVFSVIILVVGIMFLVDDRKDKGTKNRENLGWTFIVIAIIILVVSWVWVWATRKSTFLADVSAISGASTIAKDL